MILLHDLTITLYYITLLYIFNPMKLTLITLAIVRHLIQSTNPMFNRSVFLQTIIKRFNDHKRGTIIIT